eukprot:12417607-Karenia_brevis.AAC.1
MVSFLQRWEKAYASLRKLDDICFVERVDMVMDRAGLASAQQMLILVSTNQSTNIDLLKPVMIEQHARIEHAPKPSSPKLQSKRFGERLRNN